LSDLKLWASNQVARALSARDLGRAIESLSLLISCSVPRELLECTRKLGGLADYLLLLDQKVVLGISRALRYRYEVLKSLAELEYHSTWKRELLRVYVERYGAGRFKVKKLRRGDRVLTYLTFETYSKPSRLYVVEDPQALKHFKSYLEVKRSARATIRYYEKLLGKLAKLGDPLARKAAKLLLKEASELRRKVRELERCTST